MTSKLDFHLYGSSLNIVKQCGPGLSDIIQSKFGCVATFHGVDFESRQTTALQLRPILVPQKRLEVTLPKGVQLSVWKADLTSFKGDAVVNAANRGLQHAGGLAEALSSAGGPQIQINSDDYISRKGVLSTGDAIVLTAGLLPYKKIIHAVGPQISKFANRSEVTQAESLLQKTIRSILDRVKENHLQSVAIPAISSGLFNFPLPLCADTIVTTVKRYYENSYYVDHLPQEIFLVNNDEPSVQEMERACHEIISKSYSQAVVSQTRGAAAAAAARSTPTVQIGNVHLTLKKGKIEEQQTDVIVNTVSPDRNLRIGQISKALLEKAGPNLQMEINSVKQTGNVFVTSPQSLRCRAVYHTFCSDKDVYAAKQMLYDSVYGCLQRAAAHQYNSIAFPAIGTGGLRFNKKEVAVIMSNAVTDFAHNTTNRMDVRFVIFPHDNDTYQAFEEQMRSLQSQFKAPDPSVSHASGHEGDFRDKRAPVPQITLNASSNEAICEADRWLRNLLYKPCDLLMISNNFILYFGEEEHLQLASLKKGGVSILESFENGRASIMVDGVSAEDVVVAGLQVEAILCKVQKDFVAEEESTLRLMSTGNVSYERKLVDPNGFSSAFKKHGPQVVKIEEVENLKLRALFELKKKQLGCSSTRKMYQRIPAHFCEMVSHIGFHAEYAPPDDPAYGEGIYFADSVKTAMKVWKNGEEKEEYLYFVEAEVLTGKDTRGKPGLILPPPRGKDPPILYDSVHGGSDISVIFSGYQALPRYIITCQRERERTMV
ncbi:protein mono-ADP-ribosyltransferase PARP9 [Scomber scombrus]|uniref:protein mono-ADP-ribosyltransferase PARP9 n=1 Tax=Scomber scombrus TaxID=13677 RepID=UPI002DDB5DE8|nr:protein mono-ADP-ribosyltransferase PARP9 [Scomber scombrus]